MKTTEPMFVNKYPPYLAMVYLCIACTRTYFAGCNNERFYD